MCHHQTRSLLLVLLLAAALLLFTRGQAVGPLPAPPEPPPATVTPAPTPEASPAPPESTPAPTPEPTPAPTPEPTPEPLKELPEDWFDDALFLGDSITGSLSAYTMVNGGLGDATFVYVNGLACHHITQYGRTIPLMGTYMEIEDAVAASGCGKLFLLLAMNDIGTDDIEELRLCWETVLDRILEKNPGITIYVQSGTPILQDRDYFTKANLEAYNIMLQEVCASRGCVYVDVTRGLMDDEGYMKPGLSNDNFHMNQAGCQIWVENLRDPASYSVTPVLEEEKP